LYKRAPTLHTGRVRLFLFCLIPFLALASNPSDDATEGTIRLSIPEPLIFDLVRPLGARTGEIEVNTLATWRKDGRIQWAPEVEMVVGRGIALEFELPGEGRQLTHYKLAAQGKLRRPGLFRNDRYIHGWQAITEIPRHGHEAETAGLYISGVRWSRAVSSLSLNGVAVEGNRGHRSASALLNNTLFAEWRSTPVLGLETNLRVRRGLTDAKIVPQIHRHLGSGLHLQAGIGVHRIPGHQTRPLVALRLVRELR
jgi:hypothetical protein